LPIGNLVLHLQINCTSVFVIQFFWLLSIRGGLSMALKLKKGVMEMVAEANQEIETITAKDAIAHKDDPNLVLVDLRDIRELNRDGRIPGAFHAPRGMLEFWVDPASPYYKEIFGSGKKFTFFCAGGMRSALAAQTVQRMGLEPVCHIEGGFRAWKEAGGPVEGGKPEE
jgi:rhodanese-related sulfurtransferase